MAHPTVKLKLTGQISLGTSNISFYLNRFAQTKMSLRAKYQVPRINVKGCGFGRRQHDD